MLHEIGFRVQSSCVRECVCEWVTVCKCMRIALHLVFEFWLLMPYLRCCLTFFANDTKRIYANNLYTNTATPCHMNDEKDKWKLFTWWKWFVSWWTKCKTFPMMTNCNAKVATNYINSSHSHENSNIFIAISLNWEVSWITMAKVIEDRPLVFDFEVNVRKVFHNNLLCMWVEKSGKPTCQSLIYANVSN